MKESKTPNIDRIFNSRTTDNGEDIIYKVKDFKNAKNSDLIYIGEGGLERLKEDYLELGKDLTDEEIISNDIGSSKDSIRNDLKMRFSKITDKFIDKYNIIEEIFNNCDWEFACTLVDEIYNEDRKFSELLDKECK